MKHAREIKVAIDPRSTITEERIVKQLAMSLLQQLSVEQIKKVFDVKVIDPRSFQPEGIPFEEIELLQQLTFENCVMHRISVDIPDSDHSISKYIQILEGLLAERQKVLDAIPECNLHGNCIPHAIEWIEKQKAATIEKK